MNPVLRAALELSPAGKLQLIGDLWDDRSSNPEDVPLPQWQVEEIERREAEFRANPGPCLSWEEVKRQIRARHGR